MKLAFSGEISEKKYSDIVFHELEDVLFHEDGLTNMMLILSFSPTYALIYIIKILSQAVTLIAHFTPTCFDPYGSSSGSTAGPC